MRLWLMALIAASSWVIAEGSCEGQLFRRAYRTNPPSRVVQQQSADSRQWTWPGNTIESLRRHMMSDPHYRTREEIESMSADELIAAHSHEHDRHARATGNWGTYTPGRSGPFYGRDPK